MNSPTFTDTKIKNRHRHHIWTCVATVLITCGLGVTGGPVRAAVPIPTRPLHTNLRSFSIPFRYDPAEVRKVGATEVQLYVSDDQGIKWRKSQAVAPEAGRLSFNAPGDGEYWFTIRTMTASGNVIPTTDRMEPEIKVVVDTSAPQLYLTVRQGQPGWAQLTWRAVDEHLDPSTLTLHYKNVNSSRWTPLSIAPAAEGQTQWAIPNGGTIVVKGTVQDSAANSGKADMQTSIAPATDIVPKTNVPKLREPVADKSPTPLSNAELHIPKQFAATDDVDAGFQPVPQRADPDPFAQQPPQQEQMISNTKPIRSRWHEDDDADSASPSDRGRDETSHVRFRYVNSREFNIGYKIDDVGPSGVSAVEVFMTQDNGDSWWNYGVDNDRKSPARVKVPKEGRYGIALRVRSGVGLASEPPQPGERPDMDIVVDITPPQLRLLPLEQGQGVANNQILIQWDLEDQNLGEEPITLFYGGSANGPWHAIAGAHRNSGRYLWKVGQGVPSKLYIRIQAQDAAGNTQSASTDYPVLVDLARPRARIVDIEPEQAGERR